MFICPGIFVIFTLLSHSMAGKVIIDQNSGKIRFLRCNDEEKQPFFRINVLESQITLIILLLLCLLFGMLLAGFLKGFIGIFSQSVAYLGLSVLIDLPKPLNHYYEHDLQYRTVICDEFGWPVHPDTCKRTVRLLPWQTEFFLNIVFFLAFPFAAFLKICDNWKKKKQIQKCRRNRSPCKRKKEKRGPSVDMYCEDDVREAEDTYYVIDMLNQSRENLNEYLILNESEEDEGEYDTPVRH